MSTGGWRWRRSLWLAAGLAAAVSAIFYATARAFSQPIATLLEGELTVENRLSVPIDVDDPPVVTAIQLSQILRPTRELTTSRIVVFLVRELESKTATAPTYELLLEMEHEFVRTPDRADMQVRMHATIREPGRYRLRLERLQMPYPQAGGPLSVRVMRLRGSAVPFWAGAIVSTGAALLTGLAAVTLSLAHFVHRKREREEAGTELHGGSHDR